MNRKAVLLLATMAIGLSFSWSEASKHSKAITYSKHPPCNLPLRSSPSIPWLADDTLSKPIIRVRQSAFTVWFFDLPSPSCARLSSYELPPPLEISFSRIFQDDNVSIRVKWTNVEIKFDPSLKGMTLSYERKIDQMPEKVILTIPMKDVLELWVNDTREHYNDYEEAFWEEKEMGRIELEEKEKNRKKF